MLYSDYSCLWMGL